MNTPLNSCSNCPHRLVGAMGMCGKKEVWSTVRSRKKMVYLLFKNNKGIVRHCSVSDQKVYGFTCPLLMDSRKYYKQVSGDPYANEEAECRPILVSDPLKVLKSRKELRQQAIVEIRQTYVSKERHVVEIIDVSRCLTTIEKWQFRQDEAHNRGSNAKKRTLYPTRWWDKYYDKSIKVWQRTTDNEIEQLAQERHKQEKANLKRALAAIIDLDL